MGRLRVLLFASAALLPFAPAAAADQLKFGPVPAWVTPQPVPPPPAKAKDQSAVVLLHDQQDLLQADKISEFSEVAFKIQKPEGLAAGNISIAWNPATETVTVHKLEIRRGSQIIDVLASGQKFTTLRRESDLELAMLDGVLTANIQPEGLQQGDVLVMETTTERIDPVMKGHVEATFAPWGSAQIALAHAKLNWASTLALNVRKTGDLPAPQQTLRQGRNGYELTMRDTEPVISPKGAPRRYAIGRMGEATDFHSWADAAELMAPLYGEAAVISVSGPLREEVEKIRKTSNDPKVRALQALALVQDRVRYVALLMGEGGYVPAKAEDTWSRRFGDCKAKTALLLGILHELGIQAEPVLVNAQNGDIIGERLPMVGLFNHVLVRAHLTGQTYWLDGTRTGDSSLDRIDVPDFGWGLPLVRGAQLVRMVPPPRTIPDVDTKIVMDAAAGVLAPVATVIDQTYEGDGAVALNQLLSAASASQRDQLFEAYAKSIVDQITTSTSSFTFDKLKSELTLTIKGTTKVDWSDSFFHLPGSSIAFKPDFERSTGPLRDAPVAVSYPHYSRSLTIVHLPAGYLRPTADVPPQVHETLAGIEYVRKQVRNGDTFTVETVERSLVPEVTYKDAMAAAPRLKALADQDVSLRRPADYRATAADLQAMAKDEPASANELVEHGNTFLNSARYDDAIADFTKALAYEPQNVVALADRGIAYVWKQRFDEAAKDLNAALARDAGNAVALRALALMSQFKGDCAKAVDLYTQSLAKDPESDFSLANRGECEANLSKDDQALADFAKALEANPTRIDLHVSTANILLRKGKRDLVEAEADAMTRQNPQSNFAWVGAAKIYSAIGLRAKAMQAMDRALAIKPEAYVYVNRAQVRPTDDVSGKLSDLEGALKLEPAMPEALSIKASILAKQGKYAAALALYDGMPKSGTDQQWIQVERAVLLFKAGRVAEAKHAFALLRSTAKSANEMNSICWAEGTARIMLDDAVEECREAVKQSGGAAQYADSLGMALLQSGKLDEALAAYDQAIAKAPLSASYMGRAIIYARKGDSSRANAELEQAKKLDADIEQRFADYGLKL
jgi:tetratricopeptide (TPR) repeat protein/transglutaminase-like putative cysteine protease